MAKKKKKISLSFDFSLLSTEPYIPSQPEPKVPNIYVSLGNDSIKVVTKNLTWEDAKKHCEGDNANLASLRSEWTQAYVELLAMNLNAPVWIGLNKQKVPGCNHLKLLYCRTKYIIQLRITNLLKIIHVYP